MFKSNAKKVIEKRLINALKKTMKDAPKVLGNEGQKAILDNFKTQSYEGKKWKYVKNKKKRGPILVGRTRRLIGAARRSFKGANNGRIKWSIDGVVYAAIHNNGGRFMPKRQFIGKSQKFINRLKKKFDQMIKYNLR